jgi:lipase chaperone LimK
MKPTFVTTALAAAGAITIAIGMSVAAALAALPSFPASATPDQQILTYLDKTLDWYRRVTALNDSPINSAEVVLRETVRQNARQALRLGFDFAQGEAAWPRSV